MGTIAEKPRPRQCHAVVPFEGTHAGGAHDFATPQGCSILYSRPISTTMNAILNFLTRTAAAGSSCGPGASSCATPAPARKGNNRPK